MSFDPYVTLGVDRNATAEEITAAYRRAAGQAHPDRQGGSTERMTDVNMAYKILSDSEAKARYDRGEGTQQGPSIDERARDTLLQVVQIAIRGEISPYTDFIDLIRQGVDKQLDGLRAARSKTHDDLERLRTFHRRLKGPPDNPLHSLIEVEIKRGEAYLPKFEADEAMLHRCLELLDAYTYDNAPEWLRPGGVLLVDSPTQLLGFALGKKR